MKIKTSELANKNLIEIDLFNLHYELDIQPQLYRYYADLYAEAELVWNNAKAHLEMLEAKLNLRCRESPERFGLTKATEDGIKMAVKAHSKYQEAKEAINNAKFQMSRLEGVLRTLEHRKASLENLVPLQGRDYFAEPRAAREARAEANPNYSREYLNRKKETEDGDE